MSPCAGRRSLAKFCRFGPVSGRALHTLGHLWKLADVNRRFARVSPTSVKIGQTWSELGRTSLPGPNSTIVTQVSPKFGKMLPDAGRGWPHFVQIGIWSKSLRFLRQAHGKCPNIFHGGNFQACLSSRPIAARYGRDFGDNLFATPAARSESISVRRCLSR